MNNYPNVGAQILARLKQLQVFLERTQIIERGFSLAFGLLFGVTGLAAIAVSPFLGEGMLAGLLTALAGAVALAMSIGPIRSSVSQGVWGHIREAQTKGQEWAIPKPEAADATATSPSPSSGETPLLFSFVPEMHIRVQQILPLAILPGLFLLPLIIDLVNGESVLQDLRDFGPWVLGSCVFVGLVIRRLAGKRARPRLEITADGVLRRRVGRRQKAIPLNNVVWLHIVTDQSNFAHEIGLRGWSASGDVRNIRLLGDLPEQEERRLMETIRRVNPDLRIRSTQVKGLKLRDLPSWPQDRYRENKLDRALRGFESLVPELSAGTVTGERYQFLLAENVVEIHLSGDKSLIENIAKRFLGKPIRIVHDPTRWN